MDVEVELKRAVAESNEQYTSVRCFVRRATSLEVVIDGGLSISVSYSASPEEVERKISEVKTQVAILDARKSRPAPHPSKATKARGWDSLYNEGRRGGGYNPYRG